MDMKQFYKKLRELESAIDEEHVIVVSEETSDGGKAGVMSEVPRRVACQMLLEGRAKLAGPELAKQYRAKESQKRAQFQREMTAQRIQVQVVAGEAESTKESK